jgi:hypothetical protein
MLDAPSPGYQRFHPPSYTDPNNPMPPFSLFNIGFLSPSPSLTESFVASCILDNLAFYHPGFDGKILGSIGTGL